MANIESSLEEANTIEWIKKQVAKAKSIFGKSPYTADVAELTGCTKESIRKFMHCPTNNRKMLNAILQVATERKEAILKSISLSNKLVA